MLPDIQILLLSSFHPIIHAHVRWIASTSVAELLIHKALCTITHCWCRANEPGFPPQDVCIGQSLPQFCIHMHIHFHYSMDMIVV